MLGCRYSFLWTDTIAPIYTCICNSFFFWVFSQFSSSKLPYLIVFAVATATLESPLYIYDTGSVRPAAVLAGSHYAAVTDIAW